MPVLLLSSVTLDKALHLSETYLPSLSSGELFAACFLRGLEITEVRQIRFFAWCATECNTEWFEQNGNEGECCPGTDWRLSRVLSAG